MEGNENYGPRPELVEEFRSRCSGLFYMYASDRFLAYSEEYLGGPIDPKAISELKERRESESPTETLKSIDVAGSDSSKMKSTGHTQDRDLGGERPVDMPKLTAEDIEKPEGA